MNGRTGFVLAIAIGWPLWSAEIDYSKAVLSAEELLAAGKFEEVVERLTVWTREHDKYPEAHHFIGLALYSLQKFSLAIVHLQTAVKLEPPASVARKQAGEVLGVAHYLNGNPRDALPWLEEAVASSASADSKLLYTLAMSRIQAGEPIKAVGTFGKLYQISENSPQALLVTAIHLIQLGLDRDASALLEKARSLDPHLPNLALRLGVIALKRGDYALAQRLFEEEIKRSPSVAAAWHSLGELFFTIANTQSAEEAFQRAIWLNNRSVESYLLLARIYMDTERLALAEDTLKRALQIDPQNIDAYYLYARLCYKTERPQTARDLINAAMRLKQKAASQPSAP